jgi:hypothetical protein
MHEDFLNIKAYRLFFGWISVSSFQTENSKECFMKRTLIAAGLSIVMFTLVLHAQTTKPYPELKKLEPLIGEWASEGEEKATPLGPAGKSSSRSSVKWTLNGFNIEWQYSYTTGGNQKVEGREIDCYDPITKTYPARWFETDGSYTSGTYSPKGNVIGFQGTVTTPTRKFELRQTYTFAPDSMSYAYKAEISLDGKTWLLLNEGKGTRIKSK